MGTEMQNFKVIVCAEYTNMKKGAMTCIKSVFDVKDTTDYSLDMRLINRDFTE